MKLILKDKKRKDKKLRFILVKEIGLAEVYSDIPENLILASFKEIIKD